MHVLLKSLGCALALSFMATEANANRLAKDIKDDALRKGPEVVALAGLTPGMVVADVFGGGGYYSEIISQFVGKSGKVYLHNNRAYLPYVDKELTQRLANDRLPNVVRYDKEVDDLMFDQHSLDAVFYVLGYHDIYFKAEGWNIDKDLLLRQLSQAIKQDGILVVVDHNAPKDTGFETSQKLHRIEKNYVVKELEKYGFRLDSASDLLENPKDTLTLSALAPEMRRKTSRFILIFKKV